MTIAEFNNMCLQERIQYACEGKHIDTVEYNGFRVLLYSRETFLLEVYHNANNGGVEKVIINDYDPANFPLGVAFTI